MFTTNDRVDPPHRPTISAHMPYFNCGFSEISQRYAKRVFFILSNEAVNSILSLAFPVELANFIGC